MTESTNIPTATPSQSTKSTLSVPKSIHQQRSLVHRNFQNLANKCEHYVDSDVDQETWKKALDELQFSTLPQLRQHINALPKLLNPSELQNDTNGSLLESILEVQSELEETFDRMLSIHAHIGHNRRALPPRIDDKHLKESKEFRREGASFQLEYLEPDIGLICGSGASIMMEELNKSTKSTSHSHPISTSNHTDTLIELTTAATVSIDDLMKWLTSHEFINIQVEWSAEVPRYGSEITRLTELINQINQYLDPEDDGESSDDLASSPKNAIPLAQSLIPIIKLSRLFFKKIARDGFNKVPLKSFTDMNTRQLQTLSESAGDIRLDLYGIVKSIEEFDRHEETNAKSISEAIDKIIQRFDSNLLLVILYIVPLIPNSISSPNDLQHSLVTWNDLFLLATYNCLCVARSYQDPSTIW